MVLGVFTNQALENGQRLLLVNTELPGIGITFHNIKIPKLGELTYIKFPESPLLFFCKKTQYNKL